MCQYKSHQMNICIIGIPPSSWRLEFFYKLDRWKEIAIITFMLIYYDQSLAD